MASFISWGNQFYTIIRTQLAGQAIANVSRVRRPCVFICSPYAGDIEANTANARRFMRFAVEQGAIPFAPHLLYPQVLDDADSHERGLALTFGLIWLDKCEELWVFGDTVSCGMAKELERAAKREMPIRRFTLDLREVSDS
jgi:hypothetical protein